MAEAVKAIAPLSEDSEKQSQFQRICKWFNAAATPEENPKFPEQEEEYRFELFEQGVNAAEKKCDAFNQEEWNAFSDGAQKAFDGFSDTFKERAGFLVAKSNVWSKVLGSLSDVERIEKRLQLSVQMERPVGRAALFKKILEDELDVIRTLEAEDLVPISNAMRGAMVAFSGNEQAQGLVSYLFNQNPFLKELLSRDLSRVDPCMAANLAVLTR